MPHPPRVLFTWEIGQGLGHVLPLLTIARVLKAQGAHVTFALRDVRTAGTLLAAEGFTVLQAPAHPDRLFTRQEAQPQTMADILALFGFANPQPLAGLALAWQALLDLVKPDVLVANYAPLSLLCARCAGIPTLNMALPFDLPPNTHPLPAFRTGLPPTSDAVDTAIVTAVNQVFGPETVGKVADVFLANHTLMISFAALDAFAPRPPLSGPLEYCGNLFTTDLGQPSQWSQSQPGQRSRKRVFVYVTAATPALDTLRQQLQGSPHDFLVCLRGASAEQLRAWQSPNVSVSADPYRLDQVLPGCDAVLCMGGQGIVAASLLAGRPLVMLPEHLENWLTAKQVHWLGAGVIGERNAVGPALAQVLGMASKPSSYQVAAADFARKHRHHNCARQAEAIALRINQAALQSQERHP